MNIIIPMAGWGTRLRPHTLTTPKPLIKVAGKSIVQRLVEEIVSSVNVPVENITFIIKPEFPDYVRKELLELAAKLGMQGHIVYQKEALGTAHAVYMAKDFLEGPVFIAYADTLFKGKITLPEDAFSVIVVKEVDNPEQFGVVTVNDRNEIVSFVEKPKEPVSNLAIIGIYYFREGEKLREEIAFLIDNDIKKSGEYQLTDALLNLQAKNYIFKPAGVDVWMDFGNKNAAVDTNARVLDFMLQEGEIMIDPGAEIIDSEIVQPVFIGRGVRIENSIIGPHVSVGEGSKISSSRISESLIGAGNQLENLSIDRSMIGNHTVLKNIKDLQLSVGDYTHIE